MIPGQSVRPARPPPRTDAPWVGGAPASAVSASAAVDPPGGSRDHTPEGVAVSIRPGPSVGHLGGEHIHVDDH